MNGRLLPHQLGACAKVLEACSYGGRGAMLADEVGLGKTIEAGLIISELSCRGEANKVLILTPASLTTQWRDELRQTFGLTFIIADIESRRDARRNGHSIWDQGQIISSIDTAKQPEDMARIHGQQWDVVIVDEAHKLKERKTQNFILVNGIRTKVLLLLTATPMQNRLVELFNQVGLIEPRLLGTRDSFRMKFYGDKRGIKAREPEDLRRRLSHVMIRNRRVDHPELELVKRSGQTVPFALSDEEMRLYDEVTNYIRAGYLDALKKKQSAKGYLMALYQRMLTSSSRAIAGSLRRRMERIEDLLSRGQRTGRTSVQEDLAAMVDLDYNDDAPKAIDRPRDARQGLEPETVEVLNAELKELKRLVKLADAIKMDTKAEQLRALMRGLTDEKVLVFTEFRATQRHLIDLLQRDGHTVTSFHGGMSREDKDAAVAAFAGPCRVMVSTESGGEGRNLQFCHNLVNYDLPWNPMRIEQRIGRLHRIGQSKDVRIINFSTQGTIEEHVLDLLSQKIKLFEEVVGDLDMILGEVSDEGDLEDIIMRIIAESKKEEVAKRFREVGQRIEEARKRSIEDGQEGARKVIAGPGMSTYLDPGKVLEGAMEEQALLRDLVERYLRRNGAKVWHDGPWDLEGTAPRSLIAATGLDQEFRLDFDRPSGGGQKAHWVGPGTPLMEGILEECRKRGFTAIRSTDNVPSKGIATYHIRLTLRGMRDLRYLKEVHVDLRSLEQVNDPFPTAGGPADPEQGLVRASPDPLFSSRVEAGMSTARKTVETEARKLSSELSAENSRLCDSAIARSNTYYKDLEDELRAREKAVEDEKFELVRKVRAAKDGNTKARYNEELKKVNKRYETLKAKNDRSIEKLHSERMDEMKRIESRRNIRPLLDLLAVGITLPTG
jgi:superfamily II DNA or RNA helicase